MRIFLDTSVLLSAAISSRGAARELFRIAPANKWTLLSTPFGLTEVESNLPHLPPAASTSWRDLRTQLVIMPDILTLDRPAIFQPAKDRPILFSAFAWSDLLLTLDANDFGGLMNSPFYGLPVMSPGRFLLLEQHAGRLLR